MLYIGIDVGGTSIKAGIVTKDGEILHKDSCPTHLENGSEAMLADMAELSKKVVKDRKSVV